MIDLSSVVLSFAKPVTVRRTDPGIVNGAGFYVDGAQTVVTMRACIQPLNGRDSEKLPQGMRTSDAYRVYADALLYGAESPDGRPADIIEHGGEDFRIVKVERWGELGNYTLAFAERINGAT